MKVTDYAPRAAPFDTYLKGRELVGVEVGVDVGAHAEALLTYCPVALLHLVDPWPNPYCRGFCEGRLARFRQRVAMLPGKSSAMAGAFELGRLDFAYIDQEHDEFSVASDLRAWWPRIRTGGVLGYRNYVGRGNPLDRAVDAFIAENKIKAHVEAGEIVLLK
jgi:hypothetical protein